MLLRVIASTAKQSPLSRARDCFVAPFLAMRASVSVLAAKTETGQNEDDGCF